MDTKKLQVIKKDHVYMVIKCDSDVAYELRDHFSFMSANARFDPRVKNKFWDGIIRLFHSSRRTLYIGLLADLVEFCESREYQLDIDPKLFPFDTPPIDFQKFRDLLNIPDKFETREYQVNAIKHCIENQRGVIISPTGSGKSLIIYIVAAFFTMMLKKKALIIADSIGTVHQMAEDFIEYGANPDDIHKIFQGQEKDTNCKYVITTWQSAYEQPKQWFKQFGGIYGDEAHKFSADCIGSICRSAESSAVKLGFTGTLDGSQCNEMVLRGLFGPIYKVITTRELIDQEKLADPTIKCIELIYSPQSIKHVFDNCKTFQKEFDFIIQNRARNQFLIDLCNKLKGNKLVLFQRVEKHGKVLREMFEKQTGTAPLFISGEVSGEARNDIKKSFDVVGDQTLLASYGTTQQAVNIINIDHIIFASPSKSKVRVLQSIGRGLRRSENSSIVSIWDIVDNLSTDTHINFFVRHFNMRLEYYIEQQFDYTLTRVRLEGS